MKAMLAFCLLVGAVDCSAPTPLPDLPPRLPCRQVCERLSWDAWFALQGYNAEGDVDVAVYLHELSYTWWEAAMAQNAESSPWVRRSARESLLRRIGAANYALGRIAPPD